MGEPKPRRKADVYFATADEYQSVVEQAHADGYRSVSEWIRQRCLDLVRGRKERGEGRAG